MVQWCKLWFTGKGRASVVLKLFFALHHLLWLVAADIRSATQHVQHQNTMTTLLSALLRNPLSATLLQRCLATWYLGSLFTWPLVGCVCVWAVWKHVKLLLAGGCWGSLWSASNDDTTMLPVIMFCLGVSSVAVSDKVLRSRARPVQLPAVGDGNSVTWLPNLQFYNGNLSK